MPSPDFKANFQRKTDEELLLLSGNVEELTFEAQSALRSELASRGLQVPARALPEERDSAFESLAASPASAAGPIGVAAFIQEITDTYRANWLLWLKFALPAVAVAYFAHVGARSVVRNLWMYLENGPESAHYTAQIYAMFAVNRVATALSWTASCFAFAGVCSALRRLRAGSTPAVGECFYEVRDRTGSFLWLSLVLLFIVGGLWAIFQLATSAAMFFAYRQRIHTNHLNVFVLTYVLGGMVFVLSSRFGLSIPALVLEGRGVLPALFRSDALTHGQWLKLAALLMKTMVGAYVAGNLPYWLAGWAFAGMRVPWLSQVLFLVSMVAVSTIEPMLFIGFALLYFRQSAMEGVLDHSFGTTAAAFPG